MDQRAYTSLLIAYINFHIKIIVVAILPMLVYYLISRLMPELQCPYLRLSLTTATLLAMTLKIHAVLASCFLEQWLK